MNRQHRRPWTVPVALLMSLGVCAARAAADEGMWLLTNPPSEALRSRYGFEATPSWLEHIQKSCVRFNQGASASFVSADGLVMTNHHVGSRTLAKLSTPERDLLTQGFYAKTRADELKCPDADVTALWKITDVTARINAAVTDAMSPADAAAARRKAMSTLEKQEQESSGLLSQVVTLYAGARFHLYQYKRWTDVRLVMAPEQQIAYYGGDNDNFEYPRFNLDMCFFRVYENDKPLKPEHYLNWSAGGSKDGDLVFVFGHPGRTRRMYTVDHLKHLRDTELPFSLAGLFRREIQLQAFSGRSEENARIANNDIHGVSNSRKASAGRLAGLQDPALFTAKEAAEKATRAGPYADPVDHPERAAAWDAIVRAQVADMTLTHESSAINGLFGSDLSRTAATIVRLVAELPKPNADRLREFRDSALDSLYLRLYSSAPIYDALEVERLTSSLSRMIDLLGGDDPTVSLVLAGKSPQERAAELVSGTTLKDAAARKALVEGGAAAVAASKDPLIRLARSLDAKTRDLRKQSEDMVDAVERDAYAKIAEALFDAHGESQYPDATGTLRLSFGRIAGYRDGLADVPPFTTIGGLYERAAQRHEQPPFDLPKAWKDHKADLDLSTPFNFVSTVDIIGGNSGSPIVNRAGEVVGLIFDGNLASLVGDFHYDDRQNRGVAVDSRAIVEAMRKVYGAAALANELTGRH